MTDSETQQISFIDMFVRFSSTRPYNSIPIILKSLNYHNLLTKRLRTPPPPYQAIISAKRSSRMSVHPSFLNFLNSGDTRTKGELVQENSIFSTKLLPVIFLSLYCLYNYVYVDNVEVFVFLLKISPPKKVTVRWKKIWQAPLSVKHPPSNKCTSF